jgi:hypothetical protein
MYMVRWKLLMRKVTLKGKEGGWESLLDKEEEDKIRQLLRDLKELREIRFPRCVQPWRGSSRGPCWWSSGMGRGKLVVPWTTCDGKGKTVQLAAA